MYYNTLFLSTFIALNSSIIPLNIIDSVVTEIIAQLINLIDLIFKIEEELQIIRIIIIFLYDQRQLV